MEDPKNVIILPFFLCIKTRTDVFFEFTMQFFFSSQERDDYDDTVSDHHLLKKNIYHFNMDGYSDFL